MFSVSLFFFFRFLSLVFFAQVNPCNAYRCVIFSHLHICLNPPPPLRDGRLEDIRLLKKKIDDLKRQLQLRNNEVANVETLKHEVYHLQRELLQERIKVKALSEELENPMNVHRWRKLEGSDPKAYEMLQKIQTLQKRLIQKTEEAVEKDLLIQEKEKLYVELKNILARQPGPEIVEELSRMQYVGVSPFGPTSCVS